MQNDDLAEQYRKLEIMVEKRFPGRISKFVAGKRVVVVHKNSLDPDLDPAEKQMIEAILQVALHYGNTIFVGDYVEVFTLKMVPTAWLKHKHGNHSGLLRPCLSGTLYRKHLPPSPDCCDSPLRDATCSTHRFGRQPCLLHREDAGEAITPALINIPIEIGRQCMPLRADA